jgi:hypothetical protein
MYSLSRITPTYASGWPDYTGKDQYELEQQHIILDGDLRATLFSMPSNPRPESERSEKRTRCSRAHMLAPPDAQHVLRARSEHARTAGTWPRRCARFALARHAARCGAVQACSTSTHLSCHCVASCHRRGSLPGYNLIIVFVISDDSAGSVLHLE